MQPMKLLTLSWENVTQKLARVGGIIRVQMAAGAYGKNFYAMVGAIATMAKMSGPNFVTVERDKCFLARKEDASRDSQFAQL